MVLPVVQEIFCFPVPRKETLLETRSPGGQLGEVRTEAEECEPSSACLKLLSYRAGAPCLSTALSARLSARLSVCPWRLFWKELVQSGGEVGIQRHLHLVCGFFSS